MRRISVVLLVGLACAGCNRMDSPSQPTTPGTEAPAVNYTALGASDTIGYGGSAPCLPLVDCTTGTGYVQQIAQRYEAAGRTVTLVNLGVPGAVLGPEVQAIGTALGSDVLRNVLNDEAPYVPADATLVTVFVGANDANVIEKAVESGSGGSDPGGYVDDQVQTFGTDLRAMIATVQGRAPKARLVALNLPNLAGVPYANGASLEKRHRLQQISVGLSSRIDALTTANVTVVDLMCDGAVYDPAHYSDDGFHPNDAGYTHIADLITAALAAGAPSLPAASCVYMTLY